MKRFAVLAASLAVALAAPAGAPAKRPAPPAPSTIPAGATWFSTFEDANPWSKWEGYSQPLQVLQGGVDPDQIQVVGSGGAGIPAPPGYNGSTAVAQFVVDSSEFHQYADNYPSSYCCAQAKLYHGWGPGFGNSPALLPGQEAGSYRTWYYLPPDTPTFALNALPQSPSGSSLIPWVNIMQWKTFDPTGVAPQVVTAEADLLPIDGTVWLSLGGGWPTSWPPSSSNAVPAPVGRWFELRADYAHSGRIDWYVNGSHVWTNTGMPVLQSGQGWIFGIGHYSGIGTLYAKNSSFTPSGG